MRMTYGWVGPALGAAALVGSLAGEDCFSQQNSGGPAANSPVQVTSQSPHQLHFQLMQTLDQLEPYRPIDTVQGTIDFGGSVTMQDLGKRWAQTFKLFHPKVEFKGTTNGSEIALQSLAENPKLIAGVSRPVDESDLKALQSGKCKEPVAVTIGMESLALYVHQSNPIQSISPESFRAIFAAGKDGTAKAKVWGDLGVGGALANEAIATYERDSGSGSQAFLTRVLLSGAASAKPFKICSSNTEVCSSIANDPKGVGIADMNYSIPNARKVPLLVDNQIVEATEENVLTGRYPLVRPLVLVFDKAQVIGDEKLRESVVRYVLSREGQMAVMKSGFYPVDPGFAVHQIAEIFGQQLR
jgi:phosphate transport system substrate-binding protein